MKILKTLLGLLLLALLGGGLVIGLGLYNVAADDPHWPLTYRLLETARERSIDVRAAAIELPPLDDAELIRGGAGNYNAMCVGCHLHPGAADTELSIGLYPRPPRWDVLGRRDPRAAFWIIKHGIKASGMPAWGLSMDDRYLWGMVAFMQQLPSMTPEQYRAAVTASPGHSHGGGETNVRGGDAHAPPRSSFEPVDDPLSEEPAHDDGHEH